jgi:hypothetical protein
MIKPNQSSANVNVLAESDLTQVVGGCGYRRNYRWRRHHCWGWRKRFDHGREGGFESRGSDDSFESASPEFEDPSTSSDETTDAAPAL